MKFLCTYCVYFDFHSFPEVAYTIQRLVWEKSDQRPRRLSMYRPYGAFC